jgi:hypothetical protein
VSKLRDHSFLRSDPPYGEGSALVALPTVVGEAQEGEGLGFSLSPLLPVSSGEPPELDQPTPAIGASSPLYDIREMWEVHHAIIHY